MYYNLKTEKLQYILKNVIKTQYPISKIDTHKQRKEILKKSIFCA